MNEAIDLSARRRAIAAAQGKAPFDLLLTGGRIIDVATLELREADVGIVGAMIASVHPRGRFADAEIAKRMADLDLKPANYSPAEFAAFLQREQNKFAAIVKTANIKAE